MPVGRNVVESEPSDYGGNNQTDASSRHRIRMSMILIRIRCYRHVIVHYYTTRAPISAHTHGLIVGSLSGILPARPASSRPNTSTSAIRPTLTLSPGSDFPGSQHSLHRQSSSFGEATTEMKLNGVPTKKFRRQEAPLYSPARIKTPDFLGLLVLVLLGQTAGLPRSDPALCTRLTSVAAGGNTRPGWYLKSEGRRGN